MDESRARRILGVRPGASLGQAREAYRRRARMVHPDRHVHGPPAEQREAERAMAELNEAWRTIQRAPRGQAATGYAPPRPEPQRQAPPRPIACEVCGHTPAIQVDVRSMTGLLILYGMDRYSGVLCRSCGTALCRDMQAQTLTLGWWGVPAVFVNLAVLVNNGSYLRALRDLEWPRERHATAEPPLSRPMTVSKKVTARVLPWLATTTAVTIVVLGFALLLYMR